MMRWIWINTGLLEIIRVVAAVVAIICILSDYFPQIMLISALLIAISISVLEYFAERWHAKERMKPIKRVNNY